jgi:hypothetical protein
MYLCPTYSLFDFEGLLEEHTPDPGYRKLPKDIRLDPSKKSLAEHNGPCATSSSVTLPAIGHVHLETRLFSFLYAMSTIINICAFTVILDWISKLTKQNNGSFICYESTEKVCGCV